MSQHLILSRRDQSNRWAFTWIELVVILIIIFVMVAILVPAMQGSGRYGARMQCTNNLKQLGLAMHTYHDVHKTLPPAQLLDTDGNALQSWRFLLLPYMEQQEWYEKWHLDEAWNSDHNKSLDVLDISTFWCPSAKWKYDKKQPESLRWNLTGYQVVTGPLTPFEKDKCTSFDAFERGTSNTHLITESTIAVPRFSPIDLTYGVLDFGVTSPKNGLQGIGSHHTGGANAAMADGSVQFIKNSESESDIAELKLMFRLTDPLSLLPLP